MDRNIISLEMFGDGAMWEQKDRIACDGGCPKNKWGSTAVDELPLAMVYGPMQKFVGTYDPEEGLMEGTMFRGLNKPFCGKRVR